MIIKKYVAQSAMAKAVKEWNEKNEDDYNAPESLKELMFIANPDIDSREEFKYHMFQKEGDRYRLINHVPFNTYLVNKNGTSLGEVITRAECGILL